MLLSPGTVISVSIRGARLTRNSMWIVSSFQLRQLRGQNKTARDAVTSINEMRVLSSTRRTNASAPSERSHYAFLRPPAASCLRYQKDLLGVRIFDFGSGRVAADVSHLIR